MKRLQPRKTTNPTRSKGQAMVEYVVILGVLVTALLTAGEGSIGLTKNDDGSLVQALHNRYTAQAYALSLSESPELNDLAELASYYKSLDKFPELSNKMNEADQFLIKLASNLNEVNTGMDQLKEYSQNPENAVRDTITVGLDIAKDQMKTQLEEKFQEAISPF
ncbi:MAG: Flp pilus assembly pilin Flp [Pseudohongiellaceae bacterium]|jgi:Flp pilus assembly pilin Flp